MSSVPFRSRSVASSFRFLATSACLLQLAQGCGGGASDDEPGAGASGIAGLGVSGRENVAGSAGSPSAAGAAPTGGAGSSSGGAPAMGGRSGAPSGGETSGMGGTSGAAGAAGHAGTSAVAGSGGNGGSAGHAGSSAGSGGGAGSPNCMQPPAGSALTGWAAQSGMGVTTTTGGGNATPQTVTSLSELTSAVAGDTPKVIYVSGKLSAGKISIGSNKTIVGLCSAEIHGHLGLSGSANVIVRNLKIVGYGVGNCALDPDYDSSVGCSSGNDAITVNNMAHHIWFDHCDVSDGTDGNLDITKGSDFVTVSWTKFHYSPRTDDTGNDSTGAAGHRFSNLIGSADNVAGDVGHLNVTWHHDWWADNVNQRMPRTRAGKIHLFNNLFTAKGNSYCTNAGQGAALLVENSIYSGVKAPFQVDSNSVGLVEKGNTFPNSTGAMTGSGTAFTPPYAYSPESTTDLEATIRAKAGPQ